jgi:hypothetical protein
VKKRLVLTTAVVAAAICAPASQAIFAPAGPPGGPAAQSRAAEQAVPAAPSGGLAAWSRPAPRGPAASTENGFDFADAAVGLGVGLGAALLLVGGIRGRRSAPLDA